MEYIHIPECASQKWLWSGITIIVILRLYKILPKLTKISALF